jgi:hypothetical protein
MRLAWIAVAIRSRSRLICCTNRGAMLRLAHGQAVILLRRRDILSMNFLKLFRNAFLTLGVWNLSSEYRTVLKVIPVCNPTMFET